MTGIPSERADDARAALRVIASEPDLGPLALSDPRAMSNLLKDLLPDSPREKNLLVAAAEADLAGMMREHVSQGFNAGSAIRLAAASFGANTHFTDSACVWVATELAIALNLASGLDDDHTELPAGDITTAGVAAGVEAAVPDADESAGAWQPAGAQVTSERQAVSPEPATAAERVASTRPDSAAAVPPAQTSRPDAPDIAGTDAFGPPDRAAAVTHGQPEPQASMLEATVPAGRRAISGRMLSGRRVSAVLVLAGALALLAACWVPVFYAPGAARMWGSGASDSLFIGTAPTAALGIVVICAVLLFAARANLIRLAAAGAALACGIEVLAMYLAIYWQFVKDYGDGTGAGVPLAVLSAVLLAAGAVAELLRQLAASRGVRAPR